MSDTLDAAQLDNQEPNFTQPQKDAKEKEIVLTIKLRKALTATKDPDKKINLRSAFKSFAQQLKYNAKVAGLQILKADIKTQAPSSGTMDSDKLGTDYTSISRDRVSDYEKDEAPPLPEIPDADLKRMAKQDRQANKEDDDS